MNIKVRKSKSGEYYIRLKDLSEFVNIRKVKEYSIETTHDLDKDKMCAIITFYDKDGKIIETKERK